MIAKNNLCCFTLIMLLHFHCSSGVEVEQQLPQYNPYADGRSASQLEQHLFDAATNRFAQNTQQQSSLQYDNQEFVTPSYGHQQQLFNQYPFSQSSTSSASPTDTPTQLWSGPPIVVGDDYSSLGKANDDQNVVDYNRALLSMRRGFQAGPVYVNGQLQHRQHRQQQQPSDFNYGNQVIYHSEVARHHQINASPQPDVTKQRNLVIYNQPEQQLQQPRYQPPVQQQQPQFQHTSTLPQIQQQPLHASNSDLNYLRAVAGYNNDAANHSFAGQRTVNALDYSEHFQEYLRKHPRRIRPMY